MIFFFKFMMYILLPLWSLPPKAAVPLAPPPNYTYLRNSMHFMEPKGSSLPPLNYAPVYISHLFQCCQNHF